MEYVWDRPKDLWRNGAAEQRKLGKQDRILREERLAAPPRPVYSGAPIESLVLTRGPHLCAVALKRGDRILPIRGVKRTAADDLYEYTSRGDLPELQRDVADPEALAQLLGFEELLDAIRRREEALKKLLPQRLPPVPREIRSGALPGDAYGVFGKTTWWWWQKRTGDLHIVGNGRAHAYFCPNENRLFEEEAPLTALILALTEPRRFRKLVIHEGITSFKGADFYLYGIVFREVVLPSTLKKLDRLNCYTEKLKIPPSLKKLNMYSLVNDMGGHWDPVRYAAETLILPSSLKIEAGPTQMEPVEFWERLELYGNDPIRDLKGWLRENMLNTTDETRLDIRYPARWDRGKPGAYADELAAYLRSLKPDKPDWSKGNNMHLPCTLAEWSQEDYDAWRSYIRPRSRRNADKPIG